MQDKDKTDGWDQVISRKDALLKTRKYAAFTAAAMLMILGTADGADRPPKKSPKPPRARIARAARRPTEGRPLPSF